jgi:hypothetical protein
MIGIYFFYFHFLNALLLKYNLLKKHLGIAWSISLLWLLPILGWPYFFNQGIRTVDPNKCDTEYHKNVIFKIFTAIINFYLPLIGMILIK